MAAYSNHWAIDKREQDIMRQIERQKREKNAIYIYKSDKDMGRREENNVRDKNT